jgi:hypothetical protein
VIQPLKQYSEHPKKNELLTEGWYRAILTAFTLVFHSKPGNWVEVSKLVKRLDCLYKRPERSPLEPSTDKYHGWVMLRQMILSRHHEIQDLYWNVCNEVLPQLQNNFDQTPDTGRLCSFGMINSVL